MTYIPEHSIIMMFELLNPWNTSGENGQLVNVVTDSLLAEGKKISSSYKT